MSPTPYAYPLLVKRILQNPIVDAPEQEIVYRGTRRHSYRALRDRVDRLANVLEALGVQAGHTVAVMDWDSHRYLECFFAVPMIGAVLHTVNVRLSPEQILYTIDHAEDDVILVNAEFLPILEHIRGRISGDEEVRPPHRRRRRRPRPRCRSPASTRRCSPPPRRRHEFPDFDENTRATTFYTTGTTGLPKGVYFSHRQLVLHTLGVLATLGTATRQGRFDRERRLHAAHADVPRARLGAAVRRDDARREAGLPGQVRARPPARAHRARRR